MDTKHIFTVGFLAINTLVERIELYALAALAHTFKWVTICVLATGCANKDSAADADHSKEPILRISDTLRFKLDKKTSYRTFFVQATTNESGNQQLIFLSQHKPSVQVFDVASQEIIHEIPLEKEGPDGVGSPAGLLFLTIDSVFVVSASQYKVSLVNRLGKVIKSYRTLEGSSYSDNTGMLRPFTISPPVKVGNSIYFNVAPDRDVYKSVYFDGKTNLRLDLETGDYVYFNSYPQQFKKGVWGVAAVSYSTAYNAQSGDFIYSFAISDSVFTFNPVSGKRMAYYAGSRFIKSRINPMSKPDPSMDLQYALETPYYQGIVYDSYRNVYYRLVLHAISYRDTQTGEVNAFHEKPISILVLDDKMRILGEAMLPKNVFLDYIYFVTPGGLYLSTGNPANQRLAEDYAEFIGFLLNR